MIVLSHLFNDLFLYELRAVFQLTTSSEWMKLLVHKNINHWTRVISLIIAYSLDVNPCPCLQEYLYWNCASSLQWNTSWRHLTGSLSTLKWFTAVRCDEYRIISLVSTNIKKLVEFSTGRMKQPANVIPHTVVRWGDYLKRTQLSTRKSCEYIQSPLSLHDTSNGDRIIWQKVWPCWGLPYSSFVFSYTNIPMRQILKYVL